MAPSATARMDVDARGPRVHEASSCCEDALITQVKYPSTASHSKCLLHPIVSTSGIQPSHLQGCEIWIGFLV